MTEISRSHPSLRLTLLPQPFFVRQTSDIPRDALLDALTSSSSNGLRTFLSVTRTAEEWSVVGECVEGEAEKEKATWRCIKVAGPMDFGLTGIMCDLSTPLKRAGVPIFAISTWNTDYVLVPKEKAIEAVQALQKDGWIFDETSV